MVLRTDHTNLGSFLTLGDLATVLHFCITIEVFAANLASILVKIISIPYFVNSQDKERALWASSIVNPHLLAVM